MFLQWYLASTFELKLPWVISDTCSCSKPVVQTIVVLISNYVHRYYTSDSVYWSKSGKWNFTTAKVYKVKLQQIQQPPKLLGTTNAFTQFSHMLNCSPWAMNRFWCGGKMNSSLKYIIILSVVKNQMWHEYSFRCCQILCYLILGFSSYVCPVNRVCL